MNDAQMAVNIDSEYRIYEQSLAKISQLSHHYEENNRHFSSDSL